MSILFPAGLLVLVIGLAYWLITPAFVRAVAYWVRYLYFLRFGLIAWLFAPLLCFMNKRDQTLTSGILVPENPHQYLCVGFFLVSAAFAALILARVVLINGPARWDQGYNADNDARPPRLAHFLVNDKGEYELAAFCAAQIPNIGVFLYMIINGHLQGVSWWTTIYGLASGAFLAGFFWWLANAFYYLTFKPAPPLPDPPDPVAAPVPAAAAGVGPAVAHAEAEVAAEPERFQLGVNAARTILFPRSWFRLNAVGAVLPGRPSIEGATTVFPRVKISGLGNWTDALLGYGTRVGNDFYLFEAHYFATIVLAAFLILYGTIWPLSAPVPAPVMSWFAIGLLLALGAAALVVFLTAKPESHGSLKLIKLCLSLGVILFLGAVIWLYNGRYPERFPILASILILIIALCWFLGGIAFFLDRYRVPVLTSIIVAMIVPRMMHLDRILDFANGVHLSDNGREEHYLSTVTSASGDKVPTPAAILASRFDPNDQRPLIIVTSTGGGLHASAWTAAILAHLEQEFGGEFHRHLLLASTVSGGSVGLLAYLRELHEGTLDSNTTLAWARMQSAARCSSLESVGWGLIYYDLPKAFVPVFPYFISPSSGDNDLDMTLPGGTPLVKDRTWSLRKAFGRNLHNRYCDDLWASDTGTDSDWNKTGVNSPGESGLTLRQFSPVNAGGTVSPAFAMNTTSVEDGQRFLLANYFVPDLKLDAGQNYRAKSFLETFGGAAPNFADLPLTTAAQMSATFPYVSSAARMPLDVDRFVGSMHFVDGGYYDNDGTASAIEFLRYALAPSNSKDAATTGEKANLAAIESSIAHGQHRVHILLVEIRNSGDDAGTGPEMPGDHSGENNPWNALSQLSAPLLAFWEAGHEGVTARNRSALALLEHSLSCELEVHRVVFADNRTKSVTGTDPLNWSLTPAQRQEVSETAQVDPTINAHYRDAKRWFGRTPAEWRGHGDSEDGDAVCSLPQKPAAAAGRRY